MLYYEHTQNNGTFKEMIKSVHQERTKLSDIYFSRENLELIQKELISNVRDQYKFNIDKQSEDQLLIIMRSYYTLYANPETNNLKQEIIKLNKLVIDKATLIVVTNIKMYKIIVIS